MILDMVQINNQTISLQNFSECYDSIMSGMNFE